MIFNVDSEVKCEVEHTCVFNQDFKNVEESYKKAQFWQFQVFF